jgi:hypothetical protein
MEKKPVTTLRKEAAAKKRGMCPPVSKMGKAQLVKFLSEGHLKKKPVHRQTELDINLVEESQGMTPVSLGTGDLMDILNIIKLKGEAKDPEGGRRGLMWRAVQDKFASKTTKIRVKDAVRAGYSAFEDEFERVDGWQHSDLVKVWDKMTDELIEQLAPRSGPCFFKKWIQEGKFDGTKLDNEMDDKWEGRKFDSDVIWYHMMVHLEEEAEIEEIEEPDHFKKLDLDDLDDPIDLYDWGKGGLVGAWTENEDGFYNLKEELDNDYDDVESYNARRRRLDAVTNIEGWGRGRARQRADFFYQTFRGGFGDLKLPEWFLEGVYIMIRDAAIETEDNREELLGKLIGEAAWEEGWDADESLGENLFGDEAEGNDRQFKYHSEYIDDMMLMVLSDGLFLTKYINV